MKSETLELIRTMYAREVTDQRVYTLLAERTKSPQNRDVLKQIAADEARHCAVWASYLVDKPKPSRLKVWAYLLLARIFGLVFLINFMEAGEKDATDVYRDLRVEVPAAQSMMEDEARHEAQLAGLIKEEKLNYISSMVLGLNDALVELTGAMAGFTLALNDNKMIGLAGFITGVAATLSMATSEYLAKKADPNEPHPLKAATYTGLSYLFTVAVLLIPYGIFSIPLVALVFCLCNATLIILLFTFFVSVVRKQSFKEGFREMMIISFSVAFISFVIGWAARLWLHVDM